MPKDNEQPKKTSVERKKDIIGGVCKRNGTVVSYDIGRVITAVFKAMRSTGEGGHKEEEYIANKVESELKKISRIFKGFIPTVEGIQDIVERELILEEFVKTAKSYILYRQERSRVREKIGEIPEKVKKLVAEGEKYFRNFLSEFVYYRSYSRWIPEENRRETWIETVDRYMSFMRENLGNKLKEEEYTEVREAILKQETMPSMRLLWSAGDAARKTNVTAYNCSFIAPSCPQDLGEIMYILMCGGGVGFSVESQNVHMFPQIKKQTGKMTPAHTVLDSKDGWADAYVLGLNTWFDGMDIKFDYSKLRRSAFGYDGREKFRSRTPHLTY